MTTTTVERPPLSVLVKTFVTRQRVMDYGALLSGQVGRLVFSVVYFVILARTLSLGDFGLFATASSIGVVLSRLAGFGFVSPLYRIATTRPNLIGIYTGGWLLAMALSLPVVLAIALGLYALLYTETVTLAAFLAIVLAEVLIWRSLETVIIVNNGMNRYATGSALAIAGVASKAIGAIVFSLTIHDHGLEAWAFVYIASISTVCLTGFALFYPRQRLRWKPKAWMGRAKDAMGVSAAEVLFYVQSELDKVLVLALGGEALAGLYAIVMRLVDLTATPLRAASTMFTQWIMRARQARDEVRTGWLADIGLGVVSVLALCGIYVLLWMAPDILGDNIATASTFLLAVLLVPAFRNAVEFHTDLLYAHERMAARVLLLGSLGVLKAVLLTLVLTRVQDFGTVALWLNGVFACVYLLSAVTTYGYILKRKKA